MVRVDLKMIFILIIFNQFAFFAKIFGQGDLVIQNNLGQPVIIHLINETSFDSNQLFQLKEGASKILHIGKNISPAIFEFFLQDSNDKYIFFKRATICFHTADEDGSLFLQKGKNDNYGLIVTKKDIAIYGERDFEKIEYDAKVLIDSNRVYPVGLIDSSSYFVRFLR